MWLQALCEPYNHIIVGYEIEMVARGETKLFFIILFCDDSQLTLHCDIRYPFQH